VRRCDLHDLGFLDFLTQSVQDPGVVGLELRRLYRRNDLPEVGPRRGPLPARIGEVGHKGGVESGVGHQTTDVEVLKTVQRTGVALP